MPKGAGTHFRRVLVAAGGMVAVLLLRTQVVRVFISLTHTTVHTERTSGDPTTPGPSQDAPSA